MPKKKYKFIDLFAGLGGFHFALSELGHECVFASELRDDLRKLYQINFPGTRIEGDITKIKPEDIENNKYKNYKIQYDYIYAYLDFCFGYPEFKIAKSICNKYKDFPLTHWKEKHHKGNEPVLSWRV